MTNSILKQKDKGQFETSHRVLDMLLSMVDEKSAHGYALLLLWASQSNAIPVSLSALFIIFTYTGNIFFGLGKSSQWSFCFVRLCFGPSATFYLILRAEHWRMKK